MSASPDTAALSVGPPENRPAQVKLADGCGNVRASAADRERAIDVLKAAFAEGRLTKE